jgi:two-component system OmpR family sensor kinase
MHQTLAERWNRISLRSKITGVTVLMLTLGLLVSGVGTMAMLRQYVIQQVDVRLQTDAQSALNGQSANPLSQGTADSVSSDYFVALYNETGELQARNWRDRSGDELPQVTTELTPQTVIDQDGQIFVMWNSAKDVEVHAVAVPVVIDAQGTYGSVLMAVSLKPTETTMAIYLTIFLGFGIGVVILGAMITRLLVTSTFAPLRQVERTAAAIADGDFSQRLGGATPNTEVGRLNRSLNTMLSRIDRAFKDRARTIDQMRRFVGDASHELRTPLVSVRGYAELYRMGALQTPEEVAQAMERIEKEAIRMGGLVEDLLELARLDEAKPLRLAPVDLMPLARDAALDAMASSPGRIVRVVTPHPVEAIKCDNVHAIDLGHATGEVMPGIGMAAPAAEAATAAALAQASNGKAATGKGVTVKSALAKAAGKTNTVGAPGQVSFAGATLARLRTLKPRRGETTASVETTAAPGSAGDDSAAQSEMHAIVMAEENKLRQVITNLMGNALRFTGPESPVELEVAVDTVNQRASVAVIDHGEGIPPQIREKIFQRFWRADTSRARETGGSGLGLAIVAAIVASHKGSVDVLETPGGGATFRVWLPLAQPTDVPAPEAPASL